MEKETCGPPVLCGTEECNLRNPRSGCRRVEVLLGHSGGWWIHTCRNRYQYNERMCDEIYRSVFSDRM